MPGMTQSQTKICPQCSTLTPLFAPECASCGHKFRTQFAPPINQTQVVNRPNALLKPKTKARLFIFIGTCIVLFIGCFVAQCILSTKRPQPPTVSEKRAEAIDLHFTKSQVEQLLGHTEVSTEGMVKYGINPDYTPGQDQSAWVYNLPQKGIVEYVFDKNGYLVYAVAARDKEILWTKREDNHGY